jgi:proteasome lid subunit RPN8/RPN11
MANDILQTILEHAERDFPREACGLIIQVGEQLQALAMDNLSDDPEHSFVIDPLKFAQYAEHIVSVYHSHPNKSPAPSQADIDSAERCNLPFVIVGYPSGEVFTYKPKGGQVSPYIGRQFVYGVSDCVTLVVDYYQQEFGIVLDDSIHLARDWYQDVGNYDRLKNAFIQRGFAVVDELKPNDLVVMQLAGQCPNHVAVYLGDNRIIHHPSETTLSRSEMYGAYWRHNTAFYLRHEALNETD